MAMQQMLGPIAGSSAYEIERSLRFNSADSAYLNRTPSSAGNRKTWTISFWVKKHRNAGNPQQIFGQYKAGSPEAQNRFQLYFDGSTDQLEIHTYSLTHLKTNRVFRDNSAWYHIVLAVDTTSSTANNRMRLYVNGVEETSFTTRNNPSQNLDLGVNTDGEINIGTAPNAKSTYYADVNLAEINFVEGSQLTASSFGEYDDDNNWIPKKYTGSYGTNGFFLKFADNSSASALGTDSSGNNNTWTVNNLEAYNAGTTVADATGALPILNTSGDYGGTATSGVRSDSSSSHIVLALPLNGSNNGTTITDYHHTIKGSGSAKSASIYTGSASGGAVTSTAQSKYYGSSFYAVRGATNNYTASDYIYLTGDTDLDFGTGDFCVEFWYRPGTFVQNSVLFDNRHPTTGWPNSSAGFQFFTNHLGELFFRTGSAGPSISSSGVLTEGVWSHLAVTRGSGGVTVYHNGTSVGSTSTSNNFNEGRFVLGSAANNGEGTNGYYADLRIYKGTSKYTGNFTVPAQTDYSNSDSLIDSPTNYTASSGNNGGNYATLNPLDGNIGSNLTNGNLDAAGSSNWSAGHARGTFGLTSGKWYWEVKRTGGSGSTAQVGFCNKAFSLTESYGSLPANSWTLAFGNGTEILRPSGGGANYFSGGAMDVGDTVGIALDMDAKTAVFYKNGTAGASISLSSTKTGSTDNIDELFPLVGVYNANVAFNGGQRPFTISSVPTGYKALCTENMADPAIADPSTAFDVKTFTANNGSQAISLGFAPDLVWTKSRSGAYNHQLFDIVRGNSQEIRSDTNDASRNLSNSLTFDSDGFTMPSNNNNANFGSGTGVAWAWDAGTSTSNNSDGSITSSVRANQTVGVSIVKYEGTGNNATVGHGLNAPPEFFFGRNLDDTSTSYDWIVYHNSVGNTGRLKLNNASATSTSSTFFQDTSPTNSVITIGTSNDINKNGDDYILYCFAPVTGYSKFGKYSGNGSDDGSFVYTGFRPRFVLTKAYSANSNNNNNWNILDTSRDTYNEATKLLAPNLHNVELSNSHTGIDILSNGFKLKNDTNGQSNYNGWDYIYAAFAENPFKTARAR